ncbi:tryptophan synthase subunit alpha [Ureibacillus sp. 179-F W5.1 NHS]|uniref:Tryptophan synthase alpha chain n=1 Tax=Lysinibacillus halotolerans TaxID=1368476 RepID=A0A3M8H7G2_9BACI|nr:tryptophan synthase subunit alpha [Lysinibacillus halotolerans]RNC98343.1 tryptophan synthase subunit alpha [Lysinibacillus halotolerans]
MSLLKKTILSITAQGHKAFVPYIMAGDGGLNKLQPTILKLQQLGVTAIEVGIPFTDPVADGPTIERAGERALANGTTLHTVLETLTSFASELTVPLVAMTYLNPILAYGTEKFAKDARAAGIRGVIIPDMPLEESEIVQPALKNASIDLVQLVSLTSTPERIERLTKRSEGFIYAVTVNGITGARSSFATQLDEHFKKIQTYTDTPVLAGFGISTPDHVKSFGSFCSGVIVGSKIVDCLVQDDWTTIENLVKASKTVAMK